MEIPKFLDDLSIISKLGDNPGADNGLTAEGLKAKFDEGPLKLQAYLNDILLEALNSFFSSDGVTQDGLNMIGPINMNKNKLRELPDPTEGGDAVNLDFANKNFRSSNWIPTPSQVGARPDTWTPTAEEIGAVPAAYYGGDTLTWDGNTEGLVRVDLEGGSAFYLVSDAVVTTDDVAEGATLTFCIPAHDIQETVPLTTDDGSVVEFTNGVTLLGGAVSVPESSAGVPIEEFDGLALPQKGTYFTGGSAYMSALTIPGYTGFDSKSIAPDYMPTAEQVGARPDTWLPTPEEIGAVATSAVGTNKVFNKLTDIGIKTFPTTMKTIAASMPANSTLMLDSRDIVSGGVNEISDLGATWAGMYMFMRGNSNARLSFLHIYGATGSATSYLNYGCYAASNNSVVWLRASNTAKVKLWENAKITSTFNAQTISLDLSEYDGVEILYYVDSTTNIYQNTGFIKTGLPSIMYYVTASTGNRLHRNFTVNTTGIKFETAQASSGAAAGGLCIPYQIYGIKGVG